MKSHTDLRQSKILSKILSYESADMYYMSPLVKGRTDYIPHLRRKLPIDWDADEIIPCWSLSALFEVLPNGTDVTKDKSDTENEKYMCTILVNDSLVTTFANNPIDACYEMILKLDKLNQL